MAGWHHRFNGCEFEQALGVGDGQGTWCAAVHGFTKSWTELRGVNPGLYGQILFSFVRNQ